MNIEHLKEEFLVLNYLGADLYKGAVDKGYKDFCRTLTKFSVNGNKNNKAKAQTLLINELKKYFECNEIFDTQEKFNNWHKALMDSLIEVFNYPKFTYGCAQKWINMAFKYIYCVNALSTYKGIFSEDKFAFCHVPIDNYVMTNAKDKYDIEKIKECWSSINEYEHYIEYENQLLGIAKSLTCIPLILDFILWNK